MEPLRDMLRAREMRRIVLYIWKSSRLALGGFFNGLASRLSDVQSKMLVRDRHLASNIWVATKLYRPGGAIYTA